MCGILDYVQTLTILCTGPYLTLLNPNLFSKSFTAYMRSNSTMVSKMKILETHEMTFQKSLNLNHITQGSIVTISNPIFLHHECNSKKEL